LENNSDPCSLSKRTENEIMIIGINVDDYLVLGKEEKIN
jgi:hypothetical protein